MNETLHDEYRTEAIGEARRALTDLDYKVGDWKANLSYKSQAQERLTVAKAQLEAARAEIVQEAVLAGEINGKNAEERERQAVILLDAASRTSGSHYNAVLTEFNEARVAADQAGLTESIAEQEMKAAYVRCRIAEATLSALAVK